MIRICFSGPRLDRTSPLARPPGPRPTCARGSGEPATASSIASRSWRRPSPYPFGRHPGLDQAPGDERGRRGHEQQGEGDLSSGVRLPDDLNVYYEYLPLLCGAPIPLTLLGMEPIFLPNNRLNLPPTPLLPYSRPGVDTSLYPFTLCAQPFGFQELSGTPVLRIPPWLEAAYRRTHLR